MPTCATQEQSAGGCSYWYSGHNAYQGQLLNHFKCPSKNWLLWRKKLPDLGPYQTTTTDPCANSNISENQFWSPLSRGWYILVHCGPNWMVWRPSGWVVIQSITSPFLALQSEEHIISKNHLSLETILIFSCHFDSDVDCHKLVF